MLSVEKSWPSVYQLQKPLGIAQPPHFFFFFFFFTSSFIDHWRRIILPFFFFIDLTSLIDLGVFMSWETNIFNVAVFNVNKFGLALKVTSTCFFSWQLTCAFLEFSLFQLLFISAILKSKSWCFVSCITMRHPTCVQGFEALW